MTAIRIDPEAMPSDRESDELRSEPNHLAIIFRSLR